MEFTGKKKNTLVKLISLIYLCILFLNIIYDL